MKTSLPDQPQLPIPANAQSNCAFDGAMITLVPITDAAHLIHGPNGCVGNSWGNFASLSSSPALHKICFSTDMDESDIIFGGAKKLYKAILELQRRYQPAAVFVYSTCVSALIGDDINGTCKAVTEQLGIPIIPVNSPGFVGGQKLGTRLAAEALLEFVIGTAQPEFTTPYDINLIGEYNIGDTIWNILPLLKKLGIRVLAKITGNSRYKEVCYAHRAKLNVIISSKGLLKMAKRMEKLFNIPYIEASLYSLEDMNLCLRNIVAQLDDSNLQERTEKLIAEESAALNLALAPYRTHLQGKRVVVASADTKSLSIISAAKSLGMEVIAINTNKSNLEDEARITNLLGRDRIILAQESPREVLRIINEHKAQMLIANSHHQYTAVQAQVPFLDVNQKHQHPYAGYSGVVEVAKDLYKTLISPIWEQVRKPAPWEV